MKYIPTWTLALGVAGLSWFTCLGARAQKREEMRQITAAPVATAATKPTVIYRDRVIEKPVKKVVYKDRVIEKPVEKVVYKDRVVEKPVEKVVYRDRATVSTPAVSPITEDVWNNMEKIYQLGITYYEGNSSSGPNYTQAFRCWIRAAELGHKVAMHTVGGMYEMGRGVPRDICTAMEWYEKAAKFGVTEIRTLVDLGRHYKYSTCVPKNLDLARLYFKQAAALKGTDDTSRTKEYVEIAVTELEDM